MFSLQLPRWRAAVVIVTLAAGLHIARASGQLRDTLLGSRLVAERTVRPPFRDTLIAPLVKHGLYRIAVWPGRTTVQVKRIVRDAPPEFAPRVREGIADTATKIEFDALDSGEYGVIVEAPPGTTQVRIWIWEDTDAERMARERRARRIRVGFDLGVGTTAPYAIGEPLAANRSSYLEAGILIGSRSPLSLLLGAGNDPRSAGVASVAWAFAEPRFRLLSLPLAGHDLDVQLAARLAQGGASGVVTNPSFVGGGLLLTWHLDHQQRTRGLMAGFEALLGRLGHVDTASQRIGRMAVSVSWVP